MKLTELTTIEELRNYPRAWTVFEERGYVAAINLVQDLLKLHMEREYASAERARDDNDDIYLFNYGFNTLSRLCGPSLTRDIVLMKAEKRKETKDPKVNYNEELRGSDKKD